MAVCNKELVQVPEVKTVMVDKSVYKLELSSEEAEALFAVTHLVGGSPDHSRRKFFDNIRKALRAAGIPAKYDITDIQHGCDIIFTVK